MLDPQLPEAFKMPKGFGVDVVADFVIVCQWATSILDRLVA
jgi:hypothetical protein